MVVNVTKDLITPARLEVSRHAFPIAGEAYGTIPEIPKYWTDDASGNKVGDPIAQIDTLDQIPPGCDTYTADGTKPGYMGDGCPPP
jgi:hypothetical protein